MKNQKQEKRTTRLSAAWRIRIGAVGYLTALLTLVAPITPLHQPAMETSAAQAEVLEPKDFAESKALQDYNWGKKQFACVDAIWTKESHWNHLADNPNSTAFGIAQMLGEDSKDPYEQISNGLRYIEHRYENPCNAWEFWKRNYWY